MIFFNGAIVSRSFPFSLPNCDEMDRKTFKYILECIKWTKYFDFCVHYLRKWTNEIQTDLEGIWKSKKD